MKSFVAKCLCMASILAVFGSKNALGASPDESTAEFLAKLSELVHGRWSVEYDVDRETIYLISYAAVEGVQKTLQGSPLAVPSPSILEMRLVAMVEPSEWALKKKKLESDLVRLRKRVNSELRRPASNLDPRQFAPSSGKEWELNLEHDRCELQNRLYPNFYWKNIGIVVSEQRIVQPSDPKDSSAALIKKDVDQIESILVRYQKSDNP